MILYENNNNIIRIRIQNKDLENFISIFNIDSYSNIYFEDSYNPEFERYGGLENINVIENIFCEVSAITACEVYKPSIYNRILLVMDLNNILFEKLNVNKKQLNKIYDCLSKVWLDYSNNFLNIKVKNIESVALTLNEKLEQSNFNKSNIWIEYQQAIKQLEELYYTDYCQENPVYSDDLRGLLKDLEINKPFFNTIASLAHMNYNKLALFPHIEGVVYKALSIKNSSED